MNPIVNQIFYQAREKVIRHFADRAFCQISDPLDQVGNQIYSQTWGQVESRITQRIWGQVRYQS